LGALDSSLVWVAVAPFALLESRTGVAIDVWCLGASICCRLARLYMNQIDQRADEGQKEVVFHQVSYASRLCDVGFRNQDLEAIVMAEHNFKRATTAEDEKEIWPAL
jgi:hypothetical protein